MQMHNVFRIELCDDFFIFYVCSSADSHVVRCPVLDKKKGSSSYRRYRENERFRVGMNGWVDGEVTAVLAESELSSLPKACEDPRLGSVWVLAVAVRHPTSRSGGHSGGLEPIPFGCGDLLLMQSDEWSNPVIGIVQPWDPDYDLKYGVNFSINQSSYIEQQRQRKVALRGDAVDGADYVDYTMINIMVCVESIDSSDSAAADSGSKGNSSETRASKGRKGGGASGLHSSSPIGGWAEAGAIRTGVRFNMAVMGSTTTSIRECQALMSLRFLDSKLKQIVLSDNHCAHTASTSSTTAQHLEAGEQPVDDGEELNAVPDQAIAETADTDSVDYNNVQEVLDELTEEKQSLSAAAVAANSGFESDASNESSDSDIGEVDEEGGVDEDAAHAANSIEKPTSIPTPLWTALLSQYNHSQLRAIASVCPKNATLQDAGNDSSLTLLQGPPGTGKTRTILGLIAVLLAGGLGQQQQGGTKIVAGSSLRTSIKATNVATSVGSRSAGALGVSGRKLRVLICAPSNTAVDELVYRIVTQVFY